MTKKASDIALELIASVGAQLNREARLNELRIRKVFEYMNDVAIPNQQTLQHIRWHLTGEYDSQIFLEHPELREDKTDEGHEDVGVLGQGTHAGD